jgi:hypothetical protein
MSRTPPRYARPFAVLVVVLLVAGLALIAPSLSPAAQGQTGGWQYQVGVNPDLGGRAATRITAKLQYNITSTSLNPNDPGNWYAFWTAASDVLYSPNWYQVGYAMFQPNNPYGVPQRWVFIQSTADPGYFWCNEAYGFTISHGAAGQPDAGCSGNGDVFGLVLGNSYNFEIKITNDPASGPEGPIYGCNGNVRFLIGGIEIGRLADCSSGGGMTGISGSVLEPTSADGLTPKSATNLYRPTELLSSFQAVIAGRVTTPRALIKYCGYSPPSGAGSTISSNVRATSRTFSASCPSASQQASVEGASSTGPIAASTPGGAQVTRTPTPGPGGARQAVAPSGAQAAGAAAQGGMMPRVYEPGRTNLPRLRPQPVRPTSRISLPSMMGAEAMGESRAPSLPPPVPAEP